MKSTKKTKTTKREAKWRETKKRNTEKKSELGSKELDAVTGGSRNIDHPAVRTAIDAFNKTVQDAEAAKLELARSSGGSLGSTPKL